MFDDIGNRYMTIKQVASYLGLAESTIHRLRKAGDFPKARQMSPGCVRWKLADIQAWEESRMTCFAMAFEQEPTC